MRDRLTCERIGLAGDELNIPLKPEANKIVATLTRATNIIARRAKARGELFRFFFMGS